MIMMTFKITDFSLKIRLYAFCLLHNISYTVNEYGSIVLTGSKLSIQILQKFFYDDFYKFHTYDEVEATLL